MAPDQDGVDKTQDIAALEAELDRLRAENRELARRADTPSHRLRRRGLASVTMIVIGALLLAVAIPAIWLNRTVMNTDRWVATMAPLAKDPAIQDAVAQKASAALVERVDAEQVARDALPDKAQRLAVPIANAVDSFISEQTYKVVRSEQFVQLWMDANRVGHSTILALVSGHQGQAISSESGKVTLDLTALLEAVQQRLVDRGLDFVARVPISALPNREIVLADSEVLANASTALNLLNRTALLTPLLALAFLGGGVAAAPDRRKAVLRLGIAVVIAMLLPIEAIYLAQYPYVSAVQQLGAVPRDAAHSVYTIVFSGLIFMQRNVLILGLLLSAGAVVAGPSRWAVALRGGIQRGMQGMGTLWDFGAFGEWVLVHKSGLRTVGFVVALFALLFWQSVAPAQRLIWAGVFVVVWLLAIELFGRQRPAYSQSRPQPPRPRANTAR